MHKAYRQMIKLGMKKQEARNAMQVGFGTELRKGGLPNETINDIVTGHYRRLEASGLAEKDIQRTDRARFDEYNKARNARNSHLIYYETEICNYRYY